MNTETKMSLFYKRKGQSAIEYLMTYGWMLLVVAIVGGAIFATVQGQCQQSTAGFSGTDVRIDDFGITTNGNLQMQLRNGANNPVNVTEINVTQRDTTEWATLNESTSVEMGVGGTDTVTVGQFGPGVTTFESVDGCNTFDVAITYNVTGGLDNQQITGTLTDSIRLS